MATAHHGSSLPAGGGDPRALGLSRDRDPHALGALLRGGWASAEQVADTQRAFIVDAMVEAAGEDGYRNVSLRDLLGRARVARATFYHRFASLDACFLAALQHAQEQVILAAFLGADNADPVGGAVVEVLALFDARPALARVCVVEALAGPDGAVLAHHRYVDQLAQALDASMPGPRSVVSPRARRASVEAVLMLVHQHLTDPPAGDHEPLVDLAGDVLHLLRVPYGSAASPAPTPAPARDWAPPPRLPGPAAAWHRELAGQGVRKQILLFLTGSPGASNTMVAEHVGLTQGPASRRLARMAKDRLIVSRKRAGSHAWFVTQRGEAALGGMGAHRAER